MSSQAPQPISPIKLALLGARDSIALVLAAIPFGIVYGAMAFSEGMSSVAIMAMSIFVFAGSSQFIAVTLLASAAALPVILLTVFIVNIRHMLYSASLMSHFEKLPQRLRLPMAFWLTDETFAVVTHKIRAEPATEGLHYYYLGSAIFMYTNWQLCTWLGIALGKQIPEITSWGLDVAMVVAFIGIVVPLLKHKAQWACACVAFVSSLLTYQWPHQSGLIFTALLAIAVGVWIERRVIDQTQSIATEPTKRSKTLVEGKSQ